MKIYYLFSVIGIVLLCRYTEFKQGCNVMSEQTWTVVQFTDDGTVEAVPSIWIQGETCHWPTFSNHKLLNAIRKYEPLNTCWPSHDVRIFRNATFNDYLKARNKARQAEDTSDLNTEEESLATKRKIIQKKLSSSDSSMSSEESQLPPPPKLKKNSTVKRPSATLGYCTKLDSLENNTEIISDNKFDTSLSGNGRPNNSSYFIENDCQNLDVINISTAQVGCHSCEQTEKHLKTIIQQNHMLRALVTDSLAEIKHIKEVFKNTKLETKKKDVSFYTKFPEIQFPISSEEELEAFKVILTNEDEFNNGVIELSKLGGSNNYNFVKRALSSLLSDEVAMKYSWLGRKTKQDFHSHLVAKLIISSAEAANMAATNNETEKSIQNWLRRAGERKNNIVKRL